MPAYAYVLLRGCESPHSSCLTVCWHFKQIRTLARYRRRLSLLLQIIPFYSTHPVIIIFSPHPSFLFCFPSSYPRHCVISTIFVISTTSRFQENLLQLLTIEKLMTHLRVNIKIKGQTLVRIDSGCSKVDIWRPIFHMLYRYRLNFMK